MKVLVFFLWAFFLPLKIFAGESFQDFAKERSLSLEVQTQSAPDTEAYYFSPMTRENLFELLELLQKLPYTSLTGEVLGSESAPFKVLVTRNLYWMGPLPPGFSQVREKLFSAEIKIERFTLMSGIFNGYGVASSSAQLEKYFSQFRQLRESELKVLTKVKNASSPLQFYIQMNLRDPEDPSMGLRDTSFFPRVKFFGRASAQGL